MISASGAVQSATVVIVSYRTPSLTQAAVRSALTANVGQVIVVDNASGDESVQALQSEADPRLVVLENAKNRGFGTACNRGAREATEPNVIFLNSDAELNVDAVRIMLASLTSLGGRAIVGPRLIGRDGAIQRSAGLLPGPTDLVIRALALHRIAARLLRAPIIGPSIRGGRIASEYDSARITEGSLDTDMLSAACFAIGRDAFLKLGGFDERFFMYFEDADLCRRALVAGLRIRYVPDAVVFHVVGGSSSGDYRFSPMYARSMRQYLQKWWGPAGGALALLLLALRLVGHAVTVRHGTRRAFDALSAAMR